jgi:hypothetical protein
VPATVETLLALTAPSLTRQSDVAWSVLKKD